MMTATTTAATTAADTGTTDLSARLLGA